MKCTPPRASLGLGFFLLASALPAAAQTGTFNGHTYFLTKTAENWTAAEAETFAGGGHLTAIPSAAEETFIISTFCTAPQATATPFWTGGTDGNQTHAYHRTTGEAFTYTDWNTSTGEPTNSNGNEDFIALN